MSLVQPIRDPEKVAEIMKVLEEREDPHGRRMYLLFCVGVLTGLRISDIVRLRVGDLRKPTLVTIEKKTGKRQELPVAEELQKIMRRRFAQADDKDLLFPSRKCPGSPITTRTAFNDVRAIGRAAGITDGIGCHTLRKTFGYHQYRIDQDIAFLQDWYQHTNSAVTLRYIGITAEQKRKKADRLSGYFKARRPA